MLRRTLVPVCALVTALALGACQDTRRAIGLEKAPPDEFSVVSRAPLSLPPDFQLRPPRPGAQRPQENTVQQQARQNIFRAGQTAADRDAGNLVAGNRSPAELALLRQAGAGESQPNIRQTVNAEASAEMAADDTLVSKILFWRKPEPPGTVVDATRETQRLRENVALGRAASEGETPIIQRKKKALLEGIF
jgi:Protein of unknown function (DUF3035)